MAFPTWRRRVLTGAGCSVILACPAAAQTSGVTVRGQIVQADGQPVPHALVALRPAHRQRFADRTGGFAFLGVGPGSYRLQVRQIGFQPYDTVVTVAAAELTLRPMMRRVVVALAALTVRATGRCTNPGVPDLVLAPELAAIVGQVRTNAERFAFLADSFPFEYRMARVFADYDGSGAEIWRASDTVEYRSDVRPRYRPGDIVSVGRGPAGTRDRVWRLPGLADFADSAFLASHCFRFGGNEIAGRQSLVRLEFLASESLRTPDVEGYFLLDRETFQIRAATVNLTHVARALPAAAAVSVQMSFSELQPSIVVVESVSGTITARIRPSARRGVARSVEEQRLIRVRFLRALDDPVR